MKLKVAEEDLQELKGKIERSEYPVILLFIISFLAKCLPMFKSLLVCVFILDQLVLGGKVRVVVAVTLPSVPSGQSCAWWLCSMECASSTAGGTTTHHLKGTVWSKGNGP